MRVRTVKAGALLEVDGGYGARLVEQGLAVPAGEEKPQKESAPAGKPQKVRTNSRKAAARRKGR